MKEENKEEVFRSDGVRPDNFDELPTAIVEKIENHEHCGCGCEHEHEQSCDCGHDHNHKIHKWQTIRYAVIDWDDLNVRRMFFTLLTQTFDRWGEIRGEKIVFGGTESNLEEAKIKNPNFLDKENPKITIMRMVFYNKKRGVKFSFDMTENMAFTILEGDQRNIFRLFMHKFDKPFKVIAEEHMEAYKKMEEEKKANETLDQKTNTADFGEMSEEELDEFIKKESEQTEVIEFDNKE